MVNNVFKISLLLVILTFFSCANTHKQNFKVYGEESLLKDCKINIATYKQTSTLKYTGTEELKTLLFNGNSYIIESLEDDSIYTVYISYQNKLVNTIEFENLFHNASDQISHFYVTKKDEIVSIIFIGREAEIETKQGFATVLIPIKDYLEQQRIRSKDSIDKEKKLFFDFYKK